LSIGYLGTSEFAAVVLRRLSGSRHRPSLVVTPPDSRRGRGRRTAPPPVAAAAHELGLDVIQVESVNDDEPLTKIRAAELDAAVVCGFGQLIREPLLSELALLNVHPSLLPRWRGAAPIERAVMAGDAESGVTIMRLTEGLDSGPVALQERIAIACDDDYGSLAGRLAELGGELAVRALDLRDRGELELREQDDAAATYAEKIEAEDRRLDPGRPALELERVVRALHPHIGAYLELEGGERLGVRGAVAEGSALPVAELVASDGSLRLGCGEGVLRLTVVQAPGARAMPADAFLRGHPVPRVAA
jgi:methionyl-tRNA formyltransferase